MEQRSDGRTRRPLALVVAATAAVLVAAVVLAWPAAAELVVIEVPAGTQDRIEAGDEVELMPADLELNVGDTLEIRNLDDVTHEVGPYLVEAGQRLEQTFRRPIVIEGICSINPSGRVTITVT